MKQIQAILLFKLFFTMMMHAQDSIGTSSEVSIERDATTIHGTLLKPDDTTSVPVVLFISGSGPTDRDGNNPVMKNNSLKFLAEGLYIHGIASLRYDKRGIADSVVEDFREENLRFEDYVLDAFYWLKWIEHQFPKSKIYVAGHSEGSLIGLLAIQKLPVAGFISLAGVGRPADLVIKEQLKAQPPMLVEIAYPIIDSLKIGVQQDSINPFLFSLFRPSVQPYIISWFKYDPVEYMPNLSMPSLIIQGSHDIQVSVEDANLLAKASPLAHLEIIEGMNHILKEAPMARRDNIRTYSDPTLALHPDLLDLIIKFVKPEGSY